MKIKECVKDDVYVEFAYINERLSITLASESKGGSTTFLISEESTDRLKAMLFMLDETLQHAKERQVKKSLNRSLWDEAKKKAGPCSWKAKVIYEQLKAERVELEQELACACARDSNNILTI